MLFSHQSTTQGDGLHATLGPAATATCSHAVHFYENESRFLGGLSEFLGGALGAGGVCVVIATQDHLQTLGGRLRSLSIDVPFATASGRYIALDAGEVLASFMRRGWPDERLFFEALTPVFLQARASLHSPSSSVTAFGEMVAVLCEECRFEAAFRLEQLWNELARRHAFSLRCAYPMHVFASQDQHSRLQRICGEHTQVIPAEGFTGLPREGNWRMNISLQQQASTLQAALELRQREVEQRIRAEEKLHQAEVFAEAIVESSVDCVKVLDLEGRLQFINASGCAAMEIPDPRQMLGQSWLAIWPEEDRARARAAVAEAVRGSVGSFQSESRSGSGTTKSWDVKITPARAPDGAVDRLIAVSRDITELREAQLAALHAEKLATAGRMAATIAHEINNPLEAVTNFIYLAQSHEDLPKEIRQYLEIADRELIRVAHIARQTLGFYRSNSASRVLAVCDLIRDALMIYERRMRNKDLGIEISVPPDLQIYGKDGELRQVLLNLVSNAIDACPTGGRIWFRAQRTKNWTNGLEPGIRITVADNGVGMSSDVKTRVFAPFFTTKADVGTGIGLWVTKCLIEQRGGYVRFRTSQGKRSGTVMSFYLPADEAAATHL